MTGRAACSIVAFFVFALAACGDDTGSQVTGTTEAGPAPAEQLTVLVEEYYDRYLELNPLVATANGDMRYNDRLPNSLSEQWLADSLAIEQEYLARAGQIDPTPLDESSRLTYDQFTFGREINIEGFRFPSELLPIDQFGSLPVFFGQMGSGTGIQPFASVEDYDNFLVRIAGFIVWMDQAIENMRLGLVRGVTQPRVLIERSMPQLASFMTTDAEQSIFFAPLREFSDAIPAAERTRLISAYREAITTQLVPAYRRLHEFLEKEYLPRTRTSIAASELPNGAAWYAYLVRYHTTTALTPDQVHEIGLTEVKRIRAQMEQIKNEVDFAGDLPAFFALLRTDPRFRFESPEQIIVTYASIRARIAPVLQQLFALAPQSDFEVRAVEPYREQAAAVASYMPGTPDGRRPGVFYANTYDATARANYMAESIFLHEAIPGHHFQISLQQEIDSLPRFRRFGLDTAYAEGWGLYAESLGRELGLYTDPYQAFGALTAEMWRAVRLVVDTGMHHKGWSREQAIEYMRQNTALADTDIVAEVERYIAVPGQALAYKIGQRKILELRQRATRELRNRFDVRDFHAELLKDGSLPLDVLDAKMARWERRVQESSR